MKKRIFLLLMTVAAVLVAVDCKDDIDTELGKNDIDPDVLKNLKKLVTCRVQKQDYTHTKDGCDNNTIEVGYCAGSCVSYTKYREDYPYYEIVCKCCTASIMREKSITMECEGNYKVELIDEAVGCECRPCAAGEDDRRRS